MSFVKLEGTTGNRIYVRAQDVQAIVDDGKEEEVYLQVNGNIVRAKGTADDVMLDLMLAIDPSKAQSSTPVPF